MKHAKRSLGSEKLSAYLSRKKLSDEVFADRCQVHRTRIHAYRTGRARPTIPLALAIQTATKRWVRLADWAKPPTERKPQAETARERNSNGRAAA